MKRQIHPQKHRFLQLILIICTISFSVHAQNLKQTIKGRVMDKISQTVLPGATIIIQKTHPLIATTSDTTGNFRLDNVPLGRYQIEVQFMG